ncbi:AAA family ATPase [Thermoleophilia bacterium SCSIO 60948]|nr:AAA family ATPase [Thermoleophilia bacterium SCSIO 60948]
MSARTERRASTGEDRGRSWLRSGQERSGLVSFVAILRERARIVIACPLIALLLAIAYLLTAPTVYESRADLVVNPVPATEATLATLGLIRESSDPSLDVETAAQLINTPDIAADAAEGLDVDPESVTADVLIEPIPESNIVTVVAQADDPERAEALAEAYAGAALDDRTENLHARIDEVLPQLRDQLEDASAGEFAGDSLATQIAQIEVLRSGPDPTLQAVGPADAAVQISPRPLFDLLAAVVAGALIGVALALASRALDPRLRREEQVRDLFDVPILARIPRQSEARTERPLSPDRLTPGAREAYRTLRATLSAAWPRGSGEPRSALITGSSPSEGKTTTAINLATSLALGGSRVILIESDMRRPSIAAAMGIEPRYGIAGALLREASLEEALVTTPVYGPNLRLLVAEPKIAEHAGAATAELLSLPAGRELVDEAKRLADFVLIDSPPFTEVIDSLPLAFEVDQVLVVARLGKSRLARLKQLGELLSENGIRPAGIALVGTASTSSQYYYKDTPTPRRRESAARR